MIKNKKVAFVVALHQSKTHRPNGFELFNDYLASVYSYCQYPFKIFAFDNESDDKFEIENCPDNLSITRVDDQYKGGCTYTWNEGIKQAILEDYDVVIITSDDQIYNETVNDFVDTILTHEHRDDAIFGPLSNNPNNDYQRAYQPNGKIWEISGKPMDELNGFCLAMTKESIQNNYFDSDGNFFNTGKEYIWGKQDVEVQQRVGHSIVVGTCYVYHIKQGGWREIRKGLRKTAIDTYSTKDELHLIILWDENNIHEVEDTIRERFKIVKKLWIPSLDELRVDVLNIIYRFELPVEELMSVSKGTHPMFVFVVIDENPVYELKQTSRQLKYFNKNLFNLKRELRKGRSNYLHATDNIEETHDDLKVFSEVVGNPSIYDEWKNWRPTFNNLTNYFKELNSCSSLKYVVMRNFDNYPNEVQLDEHADIDVLTNDYFLFKAISGGKSRKKPMVEDGGYKVCNKVRINNIEVDVDIRHMGDNYYCIDWERDMLDSRVLHN